MALAKVECCWKVRPPLPVKHLCGQQHTMSYQEDAAKKCALPHNWKPCAKSGDTLKQYLASCEMKHNQAMSQLQKDADRVNHDIEEQIRLAARIYNSEVEDIKRELEKFMSSKSSLDDTLPEIEQAWKRRCEQVEELHKELMRLEESRAGQLSALLRAARSGMLGAALKTPNEIDLIYTEQLYSVNSQELCNQVGIKETRCHLTMLAGQAALDAQRRLTLAEIEAEEELERLKNEPTEVPPTPAPSKGRSMSVATMMKTDSTAALALAAAFVSSHEDVRREALRISLLGGVGADSCFDMASASTGPVSTLGSICDDEADTRIEDAIQAMLVAYREIVTKMFTGFFKSLSQLRDRMTDNYLNSSSQYSKREDSLSDLGMDIDEVVKSKIGPCFSRIRNIHISCKENIFMLDVMLQGAYALLNDAANLWTAHKQRTRCSRKLTLLALQRRVATHDAEQLASETSLNVAIEQLRQSPDAIVLEKYLLHINTLLNTIGDMYEAHYQDELEQLWQYMELVLIATPLFCAEVDAFLAKYPIVEYKQKAVAMEQSRLGPMLRPIEVNIAALLNWQLGLLSSIQHKRPIMEEDLLRSAMYWIKENAVTLASKHNMKMRLHRFRYERIEGDIAEVRRYELDYHAARLTSHINSAKRLVNSIETPLKEALRMENLYPIADRLQPVMDALTEGQLNKETLVSMKLRVLSYSKSFEESVAKVRASWIQQTFDRMQTALDSTYAFLSSIRLFSSGGSWALLESERAARELALCAEKLREAQSQLDKSGDPFVIITVLEPRQDVMRVLAGVHMGLTAFHNVASLSSATNKPRRPSAKGKK